MSNNAVIAAVIKHAADTLRIREEHSDPIQNDGFGPALFVLLYEAAGQVVGRPAVHALQRHLGVTQLQHVDGTRADLQHVLDTAIAAADTGELGDLAELFATASVRRLEEIRNQLAVAAGVTYPARSLQVIVDELVEDAVRTGDSLSGLGHPCTVSTMLDHGAVTAEVHFYPRCTCHGEHLLDADGSAQCFDTPADAIHAAVLRGWHAADGQLLCGRATRRAVPAT